MLIGGGARSHFWAQIIADVLGRPFAIASSAVHGPALGAARLAREAIGLGLLPKAEDGLEAIVVSPRPAAQEALARRRAIHRSHYSASGRSENG